MAFIFAILLLLAPSALLASPVQVTLFPDSARVEEVTAVAAEQAGEGFTSARLTLPGQADPSTLSFAGLSGAVIADLSWTQRQERDQTALATLNARLKELVAQRDSLLAEQESIQGRMDFWKAQTKPAELNLATMRELAAELGNALRADATALSAVRTRLEELNGQIAVVENDLQEAGGKNRHVWDVTVLFSGSAPKELNYAYSMAGCGWQPLYRLEAEPGRKKIKFSWQARIWQSSGQDWGQVHLHLATMPPASQSAPSPLPDWEIRIRERAPTPLTAMAEDAVPMTMKQRSAAPKEVRHTTYAAWDMGKRNVPAGAGRVFEMENAEWPAEFSYLLRPSLDAKAFVQARIEFPEAREFPEGSAFFLIDGATVDQRAFSFSGKKETFFFGADPFVTSRVVLKDKKTGEKGLFRQKQSFVREWSMILLNASNREIPFRLEEAKPLVRDERIKLELSASPDPMKEERPGLLVWEGSLPPGAERNFDITIKFEAPDDLDINPGWHW